MPEHPSFVQRSTQKALKVGVSLLLRASSPVVSCFSSAYNFTASFLEKHYPEGTVALIVTFYDLILRRELAEANFAAANTRQTVVQLQQQLASANEQLRTLLQQNDALRTLLTRYANR